MEQLQAWSVTNLIIREGQAQELSGLLVYATSGMQHCTAVRSSKMSFANLPAHIITA